MGRFKMTRRPKRYCNKKESKKRAGEYEICQNFFLLSKQDGEEGAETEKPFYGKRQLVASRKKTGGKNLFAVPRRHHRERKLIIFLSPVFPDEKGAKNQGIKET